MGKPVDRAANGIEPVEGLWWDRRARNRLPDPACRFCKASSDAVRVTIRTAHLLYFKCNRCKGVWQVEKPATGSRQRWDHAPGSDRNHRKRK